MKILQLVLSLGAGGAERIAVGLCNRFAEKQDDEIVLVSILDDAVPRNIHYLKDLSPKVRFINLHCRRGLQMKAIWGVYKIIKSERPDIVHCHTLAVLLFLPVILASKVRYIHTIHSLPQRIFANSGFLKRIITKYLFCKNKVLPVTISEICHQSYRQIYNTNNDICITNGGEPLMITEKGEAVKKEIGSLKSNSGTMVFIHVGRHHPLKNHDRLFRAFLRLEKEGYDFILIVLGEHFDSLVDKFKNDHHIYLLGAKRNVGDYMAQADFFVLSSDFEGLPISLLEAMSMGVIPVSTPAGGVVDVINDGENGYMTKGFDDEEFYQKIKQAIMERDSISPAAVKTDFQNHFSMEVCARRYYEMYQNAIHK